MQNFSDLNLSPAILRAISDLGFSTPSPIQAQALPILLSEPTDFLGLAATGTGKTAAFSIPLLERINPKNKATQALVLCPTRELAIQITKQIELLSKYLGIQCLAVYGGAGYVEQMKGLKKGAQVVVGTPGRVIDHIERGTLQLKNIKTVILDEADEMISMGFKESIEQILSHIPQEHSNTWLFSATMSPEIARVASIYLQDPKKVQINQKEILSKNVEQIYYVTHDGNRREILCKLIDNVDGFYGLVFFQTKALVTETTQYLKEKGYAVDCLHGDMDQKARERTMHLFRERSVDILLCTDVASRGIDVKDITHVINYSIPFELENYVHRIGRTARSGKSGIAMSLITPSQRGLVNRIERLTKSKMKEGKIPSRKDIASKKISKTLSTFLAQESFPRANELMGSSWKAAIDGMSAEEITGRFLVLLYPDVFINRPEGRKPSLPEGLIRQSKRI